MNTDAKTALDTRNILRSILCGAISAFLVVLGIQTNAGAWEIAALVCVGVVVFTAICIIPRAIEVIASKTGNWHKAGVGTAMISAILTASALVALTPLAMVL